MTGRYLYVFGYQTPGQMAREMTNEWQDDQDSAALFIEASSSQEALEWGCQISEAFVKRLHQDDKFSWKALEYPHWIEDVPSSRFSADALATVATVSVGQFPDWDIWPWKRLR